MPGNNYMGGTFVSSGTLALGSSNALPVGGGLLPTAGGLTLGSSGGNGTFDMAGSNQQLGGLAIGSGARPPTRSSATALASTTFDPDLQQQQRCPSTFAGTIQDGVTPASGGQVALTVAAGLLNLSGSNTYSGPTTVSGGTLQFGSATALYAGANQWAMRSVNGTLDLTGNSTGVGGLSGTGSVTSSAAGAMALTAGLQQCHEHLLRPSGQRGRHSRPDQDRFRRPTLTASNSL